MALYRRREQAAVAAVAQLTSGAPGQKMLLGAHKLPQWDKFWTFQLLKVYFVTFNCEINLYAQNILVNL